MWDSNPQWVPSGTTHIMDLPGEDSTMRVTARSVALKLGFDHAAAFVGFEFKQGICMPKVSERRYLSVRVPYYLAASKFNPYLINSISSINCNLHYFSLNIQQ